MNKNNVNEIREEKLQLMLDTRKDAMVVAEWYCEDRDDNIQETMVLPWEEARDYEFLEDMIIDNSSIDGKSLRHCWLQVLAFSFVTKEIERWKIAGIVNNAIDNASDINFHNEDDKYMKALCDIRDGVYGDVLNDDRYKGWGIESIKYGKMNVNGDRFYCWYLDDGEGYDMMLCATNLISALRSYD